MTRQRKDRFAATLLVSTVATLALALVGGCGDDGGDGPSVVTLEVELNGLPPIEAGEGHYEAWIAFPDHAPKLGPGAPSAPLHGELELISIGKFNVGASGEPVGLDGEPAAWSLRSDHDADFAAEAWISIETEGDTDTIPSGLLLAGPFTGTADRGTASLWCGYRSVFDLQDDLGLDTLAGAYTLETPSDLIGSNEADGIYFENGGLPSLNLPALDGEAIVFEAWLVDTTNGALYSTGRFTRPDTLDSDGAGFGGAGGAAPLAPGQEYVLPTGPQPPLPLNGGVLRAFISIEPADDNDPLEPTGFTLLSGAIAAGASTGTPYPLANVTASLPTATVVVNR